MSVDQADQTTDLSPSPESEAATPQPVETGSNSFEATPEATPEVELDPAFEPTSDPLPGEDIERLLPGPGEPFSLEDGTRVIANPLRLKEFLGLLKIVTRGAAIALGEVRLNTSDSDFAQSLISLFIFAIPEAEDEAADFLRMMVRPAGPFADRQVEAEAQVALDQTMENPGLEDLFTIIEIVITNEGSDLRRLGKRLGKALEFAQKTGQA